MDSWIAKPTSDMTLSVLTSSGEQILKVDMLLMGIMKAGTNRDILALTMNNLCMIAKFPELVSNQNPKLELLHPEAGISTLPWAVLYDADKLHVIIQDAKNKKVADKKFSAKTDIEFIENVVSLLKEGSAKLQRYLE